MSQKIEIYDAEGKVVWKQGDSTTAIDPLVAVSMANAMLHAAEACGAEIKFEVDKPELCSDLKRLALITRIQHLMRSMAQVKDKAKVAAQIVDTILGALS